MRSWSSGSTVDPAHGDGIVVLEIRQDDGFYLVDNLFNDIDGAGAHFSQIVAEGVFLILHREGKNGADEIA